MTSRKELIDELVQDLRSVKRFLSPAVAQKGDITASQWAVLGLLRHKPLTVKEVAAALGMSSSAATQLVDVLVQAGHITRTESTEDRRATTLTIRKKTAARISTMREAYISRLAAIFETLTNAELRDYVALTKKIAMAAAHKHKPSL